MPRYKMLDGVELQFTAEEETVYEAELERKEKEDKEYLKVKYKDDRKAEYGDWATQLEEIYDSGLDEWKKRIKTIKEKYPKPE